MISAVRVTRGVVAAGGGLALWGLSFPLLAVQARYFSGWHVSRGALYLPQVLIVAGILLTLLEEHVSSTERRATHDPLTELPNRRLFEERLIATMAEAQERGTTVACLVIDVDNFKTINDTLGHEAGDQLLRALAVRLSWHMSPRDILARTGGDEFTALLAGVTDEHHLRWVAGRDDVGGKRADCDRRAFRGCEDQRGDRAVARIMRRISTGCGGRRMRRCTRLSGGAEACWRLRARAKTRRR